jgi:hypothetical protein
MSDPGMTTDRQGARGTFAEAFGASGHARPETAAQVGNTAIMEEQPA